MVWDKLVESSKRFEQYEGKLVRVNMHMQAYMGNPRNLLYVGNLCFAESCTSSLTSGKRVLNGWQGFPGHVGLEDNLFTIYNNNPQDRLPLDSYRRLILAPEQAQRALELWDTFKQSAADDMEVSRREEISLVAGER